MDLYLFWVCLRVHEKWHLVSHVFCLWLWIITFIKFVCISMHSLLSICSFFWWVWSKNLRNFVCNNNINAIQQSNSNMELHFLVDWTHSNPTVLLLMTSTFSVKKKGLFLQYICLGGEIFQQYYIQSFHIPLLIFSPTTFQVSVQSLAFERSVEWIPHWKDKGLHLRESFITNAASQDQNKHSFSFFSFFF